MKKLIVIIILGVVVASSMFFVKSAKHYAADLRDQQRARLAVVLDAGR